MLATKLEHATKWLLAAWRDLSLDAKVVGALGVANALLLVANHTTVQVSTDATIWRLFPGIAGPLFLVGCLAVALGYPLRDRRWRGGFTTRQRVAHLAALVGLMVVLPTIASIVLRETGKPYTYVHDGVIIVEEASRKLLAGHNPYGADYLDTPLVYWPMINNPALYHVTYFPLIFLLSAPFVWLFDHARVFFDERYLYLPAYIGTLAVVPLLVTGAARRIALVAAIALNPELFPFVVEGRNDFFVLVFLFAGIALLQRDRRTLGVLAVSAAAAAKLHALLILPFVLVYLFARERPRTPGALAASLVRTWWPSALLFAFTFAPFLVNDFAAFYDDVVAYNAGGSAWTYPISGVGFSALLLAVGVIPNRQADFPFAAIQLVVALPIAAWWLRRLWREPTIATLLCGYALTLLAFLFFARYFQGNYLGFILAVASPVPLLATAARTRIRARPRAAPAPPPALPSAAPVAVTVDVAANVNALSTD